jgi:hypothetical protein
VDDLDNTYLICQHFLRFRVELNYSQPLIHGFHLPRPSRKPLWIKFRYERLGDYFTLCGLIGHKKIQCSQPPNRVTPDKYRVPLQTFFLYGMRQNLSPTWDDSDYGISSVGTSHSHSEAQSSPAHGAKSALQLVPCQHFSHPGIHVAPSQGSQAMQLASTIGIQSHTLLSPSALHFHDDTYVASPQSLQLLPIEFYTQVGGYPLASSGHTTPSPGSLAATSQLGASR